MNFKAIVFIGFNEPSSRKNINDYFKRQYENAKKENYSLDEFFDGCIDAVRKFEGYFDDRHTKNTKQLLDKLDYEMEINRAKADPNRADVEKKWMGELSNLKKKKEDLSIQAGNMINPYKDYSIKGWIKYSDLEQWKTTIEDVKLSLQSKQNELPSNMLPLDFKLNQSQVIFLFDILQDAGFLDRPINHDGSYYRKLEAYFTAKKIPIKDAEQKRNKYLEGGLSDTKKMKEALIEAIKHTPD